MRKDNKGGEIAWQARSIGHNLRKVGKRSEKAVGV
jgi:hypothetical protein